MDEIQLPRKLQLLLVKSRVSKTILLSGIVIQQHAIRTSPMQAMPTLINLNFHPNPQLKSLMLCKLGELQQTVSGEAY